MNRSTPLALLLASVAVGAAAYAPGPADADAALASRVVRPDSGFANLQVLPDTIGRDALMAIMQGFRASLGVRCTHCHVREGEEMDFASDANPHKDVARGMMRMTRDINTEWLADMEGLHEAPDPTAGPAAWRVTCWTCHRGAALPEVRPPAPDGAVPTPAPGGAAPAHDGRAQPAPADSAQGRVHRHSDGSTHRHDD